MAAPPAPDPLLQPAEEHPPGALLIARRFAAILGRPLERFLEIQAASGIVLIAAAAIALIWANSAWSGTYHSLLETPIGLRLGDQAASASLHFVVNDVLMSIFFLLVGLEIRRELHHGELSDPRRAALPVVAAIGGMVVPAAIFAACVAGGPGSQGWGVPMATDIAFAVGILALLGRRIPPALRVLLLALAIIDDLGAILVIAIFYSGGLDTGGLAIAAAAIVGFVALYTAGVRAVSMYLLVGIVLWVGVLQAGVHPTIAGVLTGLAIPTRAWPGHEAVSPAAGLEHALHPWVAYAIMPVFALANAGVDLGGIDLGLAPGVAVGVAVGLVVGKPLGIVLACAAAVRLGIATLPRGVTWPGIVVVGAVGGIGFTMALFIAQLAFAGDAGLHGIAKIAVLVGSVVAALTGLVVGRLALSTTHVDGAATSVDDAERSHDA